MKYKDIPHGYILIDTHHRCAWLMVRGEDNVLKEYKIIGYDGVKVSQHEPVNTTGENEVSQVAVDLREVVINTLRRKK